MKLALSARVTCDPKKVLEDRWAHDMSHRIAECLRKVLKAEAQKKARKT